MKKEKSKITINEKIDFTLTCLKWIYKYTRKNFLYVVAFTIIGMSSTLVMLVGSMASRDMIDIVTGNRHGELFVALATIIGTQLLTLLINQTSAILSTYITTKVDNSIKADMYDAIMNSKWEALDEFDSGFISARWAGDSTSVATGLLTLGPNIINYTFKFATAFVIVVTHDISFAVFALVSVPLNYLVSKTNAERLRATNRECMVINSKMSLFVNESFINTQMIKGFDLISLYRDKLQYFQGETLKNRLKTQKVSSINAALYSILTIAVTYSTLGWGIYQVWHGKLTYGNMTLLIGMAGSLTTSVQSLVGLVPSFVNMTMASSRLMQLENLPKDDYSEVDEVKEFIDKNKEGGIGVFVDDTSFVYKKGTKVFENASFEAHPGEIIGIVGPSGEGKTTLLRLLLSIISSEDGKKYIFSENDSNARMNITASVRQAIAYVPQGNTLFAGTIAENMRNFKPKATDEEIIEALKQACAWDFVSKMKDGIYTEIKERGSGLSEGQAQRLSIARALLKDSPIILLDEATSALDMKTGNRVMENIMDVFKHKTCIMTTHRPEIMANCSRIYEIDQGKMIERQNNG